eukprot:TRINITY_DN963_c0_g3_i1.p1 TRINITY_DN963_c0_g3~~TRINITY_DN963_c0_g3_i1.p1  ORF type:complete len:338 (-),score=60.38 TRINITY_DN963_c0_g3_i1:1841-2854(-)
MSLVFVTGATGFLGSHLCHKLDREGCHIRILTRPKSDVSALEGVAYTHLYGDITDRESIDRALRPAEDGSKVDCVFHVAGLVSYDSSDRQKMEDINVQGTKNVVDACLSAGVRKLVFVSSVVSVGVCMNRSDEPMNEDAKYNLGVYNLGYCETKRKAEDIVFEAGRTGRIDVVAICPSTIYGAGDALKDSRSTQLKVARGRFPIYTNGGVSIAGIDSTVDAIYQAYARQSCKNQRYIISGENITLHELFRMIASEAHVPPPSYRMPDFVVSIIGFFGELFGIRGFGREKSAVACRYWWYKCEKAQRELGYKPVRAIDAIRESVQWMREQGLLTNPSL